MIYGQSTYWLCLNVPWQNVELYLHWYHIIKKLEDERKHQDFTPRPFENLRLELNILKKRLMLGHLTNSEANGLIERAMIEASPFNQVYGKENLFHIISILNGKRSKGRPKDKALDFLVCAIAHDLNAIVGRPRYEVISGFLREQSILNRSNISALQRRNSRTKINDIFDMLDWYLGYLCHSEEWSPKNIGEFYYGITFLGRYFQERVHPVLRPRKISIFSDKNTR